MQFSMTVEMDNAAFDDPEELARILRDVATVVESESLPAMSIFDINGNKVGKWSITGDGKMIYNGTEYPVMGVAARSYCVKDTGSRVMWVVAIQSGAILKAVGVAYADDEPTQEEIEEYLDRMEIDEQHLILGVDRNHGSRSDTDTAPSYRFVREWTR